MKMPKYDYATIKAVRAIIENEKAINENALENCPLEDSVARTVMGNAIAEMDILLFELDALEDLEEGDEDA